MREPIVAGIPACLEPSTATIATTQFAGFLIHGALGTRGGDRRFCCSRTHISSKTRQEAVSLHASLHVPLQASMPSVQVYSNESSLSSPHFLNQVPPYGQQLSLPFFLLVPHCGHTAVNGETLNHMHFFIITTRYRQICIPVFFISGAPIFDTCVFVSKKGAHKKGTHACNGI